MKLYRKRLIGVLCALTAVFCSGAFIAFNPPVTKTAGAESTAISLDFTDTMDGAAFKAPASNYGWKVAKGTLTPDNSLAENAQIGYLEEAIALNENKYISLDFYASACRMDIMLLPYAETVNPWATGVGVHCTASGWLRLDTYIDANTGWLGDYTGIGNGVDGYAHKLEITSDGTNLTFKVDGVDAFTGATVAIPADSVQLVLRAPKGSYIDNLYIADSKPTETETVVDVDFTDKTDLNDFTTMALNGWTGGNGKYHPVDAGAMYNASATKYNTAIDLTGTKYISFDFYSTAATFDVGLLDTAAGNIWGNALFIHLPFSDGTIGVNDYVDCTAGNYLGGNAANLMDGNAHTMEIFVADSKVSYTIDGSIVLEGFNIPANEAYLVFRAVGTESYIDNLYIADSVPNKNGYDFESIVEGNDFEAALSSAGWSVVKGEFVANQNWATTQYKKALDLTKEQEITFDVYLTSADSDKQFNVGFFSEENLAMVSSANSGKTYSLGSTLFLGSSFTRNHWIVDVVATLYNNTWHSVKITVADRKLAIAVDGVAYDTLTTDIPADRAYMLIQSTNTANAMDNLKIKGEETTAPPVEPPVIGVLEDIALDFEDTTDADVFLAYGGSTGWSVADGVFKPNADWATVNTGKLLDLTKDQQITFDVYLSSSEASNIHRQFNIGFFETTNADTNTQAGSGVNYSLGATMFYGSSFGRTQWVADVAADLYNDTIHSVKVIVKEGKLSVSVDGVAYDTLTTDIPAESVFLLLQSTSTATYVDNFNIGEIVEDVPEVNPYEGIFENYGSSAGWSYVNKKFAPNAAWSVTNTVNTIDFTKNQEITFDVYLTSSDNDKQFNVGFFETKVEETNMQPNTGLTFSFGTTIWVSTNFGRQGGASECVKNYYTDGLHNVKITVIDKQISLTVDNELLYFLTNGEAYTPTLTVDSAYLLMQATSTQTYIENYQVKEVVATSKTYTVTFQNWDGSVLQSTEILEGRIPVYEGATPVKAADTEYTYTFKGWDKEIVAVTGEAVYVAQFEATAIPTVETVDELQVDFADETQTENFTAIANEGWKLKDGKYYPAQAGALYNASAFQLTKAIDLTVTKYISMDFYATGKTFDIGFLDVSAVNMWGNALFIHIPFADGTIGVNTYVDCTVGQYLGGSAINVMDGVEHNLKIVVQNEKVSYVLDGVTILEGYDIPSQKAYLVVRAVGEESYIDNLTISNEDIEYIPPVIDDSYDEAELDFTAELDGSKYFSTLDINGWAVKDGMFLPEYMPWAATYLKQPVDMSGEKYISFDFLAVKDNFDETQSQFNMMFLTDLERFTCSGGIHCFMEASAPVLTVNRAMGNDKWVGTSSFNWTDGKYHNMMIIIKDGTITFEVDGQPVKDSTLGTQIVIELTEEQMEKETYFGLQATNVMSRIDNFKVKNAYTEYVAPTPEEEIVFEEFEQSFVAGEDNGFVNYQDSVNWTANVDGKFSASKNWAKAYLDKEIPLTDEKTVTLNFNLSTAESGHQFTIGFSWEKNSYYGVYLIFYQGNVSLNYGTAPQVRLIDQTSNAWYDGEEHTLKMIVKNEKLAIVIDGEVIFKDIQVAMSSGYFTVQSSTTADWIDDLSIVNDAEPLSKPEADGDIATPPVDNDIKNEVSGQVQKKTLWQKISEFFNSIFASIKGFFANLFK